MNLSREGKGREGGHSEKDLWIVDDSGREDAPKDRWYLGCCRCGGDDACWSAGGRRREGGSIYHGLDGWAWLNWANGRKANHVLDCCCLRVRVPPVVVVIWQVNVLGALPGFWIRTPSVAPSYGTIHWPLINKFKVSAIHESKPYFGFLTFLWSLIFLSSIYKWVKWTGSSIHSFHNNCTAAKWLWTG